MNTFDIHTCRNTATSLRAQLVKWLSCAAQMTHIIQSTSQEWYIWVVWCFIHSNWITVYSTWTIQGEYNDTGKIAWLSYATLNDMELYNRIESAWRIYALVNLASLVQITAFRLFDAKPFSEPVQSYCQFDTRSGTKFSQILIEIDVISFNNMHLKMSSRDWKPLCISLDVSVT